MTNQRNALTTVIGADSYGIALAITLARNGHEAVLWGHDPEHVATLERDRCNTAFLPDVPFPSTLHPESDLTTALVTNHNVLVAVPSHVSGEALCQIKPLIRPDTRLVWVTKGLEAETGRLLQDVARETLGDQVPLVVTSGPTFAKELAAGLPMTISLASTDQTFADDLQQLLHCGKSFRVRSSPNFIGVQLGGAVKNIIAIGAGTPDGIGFGANARTVLITRRLAEVSCLGAVLGADPAIFMSMAGLGNLVPTYTDNQPRNRRFGMAFSQGIDVQSTQGEIGQVAEGYRDTKEIRELTHHFDVGMPITEEIYQVLYCGKNACGVALTLLGCARKDERSSHWTQGAFVTTMTRPAQDGLVAILPCGVGNVV